LRRLDALLDDLELVQQVCERLGHRWPDSRGRGRPGTPADVTLRLLVLQRLRGWTFDETEREVRASLVYRWLSHVYLERVPDAKTLIRLSGVVGDRGVRALHERVVALGVAQAKVQGRRGRLDTTVVETNVHYPTDSSLLGDGIRVVTRTLGRIEAATGRVGRAVRNRMRATRRRLQEIGRLSRVRGGAAQERLRHSYRELLAITRATVSEARRIVAQLENGERVAKSVAAQAVVERAQQVLDRFLTRVEQVIKQTRARLFRGETRTPGKLLSLFEPHTEVIRKGKAAKPNEFGNLVKIQEAERGLILDYQIWDRRPADQALLLPAVAYHQKLFGRAPRLLAADAGFWSTANRRAAEAAGVRQVCVPATGRRSAKQRAMQRERWFRRGQRWRTGCEGRISVLKRRDGLQRCRYRGFPGMERWVGWGVLAHNIRLLINK